MPGKPIVVVGEAQGKHEAQLGLGFVGPSGVELLRMMNEAGLIHLTSFDKDYIHRFYTEQKPELIAAVWDMHPEVFRTNVFQHHPPRNDLLFFCGPKAESLPGYPPLAKSKYVRNDWDGELDRLGEEIISRDPNLVIALGNTAIWALAGRTGITKLRGTTLMSSHTVSGYKLLPTFHPAAILRQWENRPIVVADLMKAAREATFPEIRRPFREIHIEPTIEEIRQFVATHILGCDLLSVDIETSGQRVTCIGFSPNPRIAIVIPFVDERRKDRNYWPTAAAEREVWGIIREVLGDGSIPKLFQNGGGYDIGFLWRGYKMPTVGAREDTMLLAHALQPEMLKGLGFLGSIYSDEGAWKHMRIKTETLKRDN